MNRTIAIGDIHGCSIALDSLLKLIDPQPDDTIITLGDYVDRGIDSKGVLELLIELSGRCHLVPILGNHDDMMLKATSSEEDLRYWLDRGGITALDSYGDTGRLNLIPAAHFRFLQQCVPFFETDTHFFVHANYKPDVRLEETDDHTLRWLSLRDYVPSPHCSGKIAVMGHTPQKAILDMGHLICLDTGCVNGGWLSAMEMNTRQVWQVDERGSTNCTLSFTTTPNPMSKPMKVSLSGPDDLGYWFLDDENGRSFPLIERYEDHPDAAVSLGWKRPEDITDQEELIDAAIDWLRDHAGEDFNAPKHVVA